MTQWDIKVFVDEDCPLCRRESSLMRRLDKGRGGLALENIADPAFDASRYGVTRERMMETIHGALPDGRVVTGMEVFRRAYAAVGWGWVLAWTAWPGLGWLSDRVYAFFARHRLRLTGRCDAQACAPRAGR